MACEENTRFAGNAFSQFVDLQGGTLWRADFHLGLKPKLSRGEYRASHAGQEGEAEEPRKASGAQDIIKYEFLSACQRFRRGTSASPSCCPRGRNTVKQQPDEWDTLRRPSITGMRSRSGSPMRPPVGVCSNSMLCARSGLEGLSHQQCSPPTHPNSKGDRTPIVATALVRVKKISRIEPGDRSPSGFETGARRFTRKQEPGPLVNGSKGCHPHTA